MHIRHAQERKVGFRAKMQANSSIMRTIQAKIVLLLFGFVPLLAKVLTFAILCIIFAVDWGNSRYRDVEISRYRGGGEAG